MESKKNKSIILIKVSIIILALLLGYFGYRNNIKYKKVDFGVEKDHYLLQAFYDKFPGKEVVKCKLGDVSGNGKDDLIIIFRKTKELNHLVVAINSGKEIYFSEESKAPYENQKIEIKDIDNSPPNEFFVSGSKRGQYGYGVFRIEGKHLHNLFSEGMGICW